MIVVRDIFHLKFGKAKDAKVLFTDMKKIGEKFGYTNIRILSDLVASRSYTFVMESNWESLSAWENSMKSGLGSDDFQKWYQKFIPLCESASREILNVVEL